jgi:DNA-directed RNA polymerase subunit beta'
MSDIGGRVDVRLIDGVRHVFVLDTQLNEDEVQIPAGWSVKVDSGETVETGAVLAESGNDADEVITARYPGRFIVDEAGARVVWESKDERDYEIPAGTRLLVLDGQIIEPGGQLTEGSKNPHRILEIQGRDAITQYLLTEMQQVYRPQGQNINESILRLSSARC